MSLAWAGGGAAEPPRDSTLLRAWEVEKTSTVHLRWVRDNPGENKKLSDYWSSGGPATPLLATAHGRAWLAVARVYWA